MPPESISYVYVHQPRREVVDAVKHSGRPCHLIPLNEAGLWKTAPRGVLLFAEGEILLSALQLAWPATLGMMDFWLWRDESTLSTSPVVGWRRSETTLPLPDLFTIGVRSSRGRGALLHLLRVCWPALGRQQEFNRLVQRSLMNLESLLKQREQITAHVIRELLKENTLYGGLSPVERATTSLVEGAVR
ncbi:MAG: hypothetical protein HYZ71_11490 [Deltaproteobacteria bacterium]|nr:hypothetical protein [Deltaproteobacteria bacterium]